MQEDSYSRQHRKRRDGSVRDSVMYSILREEWPPVKNLLELRLARRIGRD